MSTVNTVNKCNIFCSNCRNNSRANDRLCSILNFWFLIANFTYTVTTLFLFVFRYTALYFIPLVFILYFLNQIKSVYCRHSGPYMIERERQRTAYELIARTTTDVCTLTVVSCSDDNKCGRLRSARICWAVQTKAVFCAVFEPGYLVVLSCASFINSRHRDSVCVTWNTFYVILLTSTVRSWFITVSVYHTSLSSPLWNVELIPANVEYFWNRWCLLWMWLWYKLCATIIWIIYTLCMC